mmetsp:Transcript_33393/g.94400  ORF Transcript_33393/g.94400 Transcript_33393/m.94400 type:complete len:227 (+) Transcript_33393:3-683(+)
MYQVSVSVSKAVGGRMLCTPRRPSLPGKGSSLEHQHSNGKPLSAHKPKSLGSEDMGQLDFPDHVTVACHSDASIQPRARGPEVLQPAAGQTRGVEVADREVHADADAAHADKPIEGGDQGGFRAAGGARGSGTEGQVRAAQSFVRVLQAPIWCRQHRELPTLALGSRGQHWVELHGHGLEHLGEKRRRKGLESATQRQVLEVVHREVHGPLLESRGAQAVGLDKQV